MLGTYLWRFIALSPLHYGLLGSLKEVKALVGGALCVIPTIDRPLFSGA